MEGKGEQHDGLETLPPPSYGDPEVTPKPPWIDVHANSTMQVS
jgi:hypothetical protein